ncbi:hypothetical protein [Janthinobacterium sp. RB2R34]|uniref:hypothetical protein n=1 Tax=Janthinobacterium sp. RB2R34 TaxID=3424193 RepID=UPI003F269E52
MSISTNGAPIRLTNFWLKVLGSIIAIWFDPLVGPVVVILFWIWNLTSLSRRKAAARREAALMSADKAGVATGDENGVEWTYSCSQFDLMINFERDEARLISHVDNVRATRLDNPFEPRFDQTFRFSDMACSVEENSTNIYFFVFPLEFVIGEPITVTWRGDELIRKGSGGMFRICETKAHFAASFNKVGPVLVSDFYRHWAPIDKKINPMSFARGVAYVAERQDAQIESMLKARAAWTAQRDISMDRVEEIKKLACLVDALSEIGLYGDGSLAWTIAADKSGQAVIQLGSDVWMGSLKDASANASLDEIPAKIDGLPPTFALGIVVKDDEFERSQLRKRRFQLMVGYSKAQITTWIDRIEILAR